MALQDHAHLKDPISYKVKRLLLGNPLNRHTLSHQRLSKRFALGVLSSDCISSSAYGSEQILLALIPAFGLAAFSILMPMTLVVLAVLILVTLSYREVVSIYTKSGGAYVVSRDNFGPVIAQVAAVALMLDYIVTVAVQSSAGVDAIVSTFPSMHNYKVILVVAIIALLTYINLRGVKEAGAAFALPTYLFVGSMFVVFIMGIYRSLNGTLPQYDTSSAGAVSLGTSQSMMSLAAIFILLRAFANGGASLTGLEAISDGVTLFKSPEGKNARKTLVAMSALLGTLVFGISWFAHKTLSIPYEKGSPTVISQVAKAALGQDSFGLFFFFIVQATTMLILFTGANTAYSGFPYLVNFVANDGYLPRQLTKRGHRLAFSNGILLLAGAATVLVIATGASVERLVAFYALGVFTGFSLTGFGMARRAKRLKEPGWRWRYIINLKSGAVSFIIVVVFSIVKFTEGAWLILVLTPILVVVLLRLNQQYRLEQAVLGVKKSELRATSISRHNVTVLVDSVDIATVSAVRYARSLNPHQLNAVHFVIDDRRAENIKKTWAINEALQDIPLELIDCPDRRLANAAVDYSIRATTSEDVEVTLLLPRRAYSRYLGKLLHDQTADEIARPISELPRVVATIVPFDVDKIISGENPLVHTHASEVLNENTELPERTKSSWLSVDSELRQTNGFTSIGKLTWRKRAKVEGRVSAIRTSSNNQSPKVEVEIWDETGGVTLQFLGRREISGLEVGEILRAEGMVGESQGSLTILNPSYEIIS
jgi:amino acid transporter